MRKNIFNGIIILACFVLILASFNLAEAQTQGETTPTPRVKEYKLLAPLPTPNGELGTFDPASRDGQDSKLGEYLNIIFRLFIGICAVLAVIMIVMGGIEYMTSELVSSKEAGRKRISGAIFGLLLALGAYTILNEINSDLLRTDLRNLKTATVNVEIESFDISEAQSIDGKPGEKVSFKSEACPAATAVQGVTGVDRALILSIFKQESSGGVNTGGCLSDGTPNGRGQTANMFPGDEERLKTILAGMGKTPPVYVSCAAAGGHGGAMGVMQILPSTWLENGGTGKNPWDTGDAMMVAARYISDKQDPYQAACKYFGKCSFGGVDYARQVVDRMASINAQIVKDGC